MSPITRPRPLSRPRDRRAPRGAFGVLPATLATVVLVAASAFPDPASAQSIRPSDLSPFTITYTVGNNLVSAGNATLALAQQEEDRWSFTLRTRPTGIFKLTGKGRINERSEFETVPDPSGEGLLLRPQTYTYRQDDELRRAVDASWDWDAGTLEWMRRGETDTAALDPPVIDRLSVTLGIMSALRRGEDESEYHVFDTGRIKHVIFENQGLEMLETSLGELETVRVLRRNEDGSTRTTVTWFAPSIDYMPVKIEQYKRDDLVARLTLRRLKTETAELDEPLIAPAVPVAEDAE